jgi:hypothetical protein
VFAQLKCAGAMAVLICISVSLTTNSASAVTAEIAKKCSALTAKGRDHPSNVLIASIP